MPHFNWRVELHPVLVHFPIALLSLALLFDVIAWRWKSQRFRDAALYSLVAGAIGTALSVVSGPITPEAREREGARILGADLLNPRSFFSGRLVEVHKHWGYVLLALVAVWLVMRVWANARPSRWQGVGLAIGVLTLMALLLTGYYGGELVYGGRGRGQVLPLPRIDRSWAAPLERGVSPSMLTVSMANRPQRSSTKERSSQA